MIPWEICDEADDTESRQLQKVGTILKPEDGLHPSQAHGQRRCCHLSLLYSEKKHVLLESLYLPSLQFLFWDMVCHTLDSTGSVDRTDSADHRWNLR